MAPTIFLHRIPSRRCPVSSPGYSGRCRVRAPAVTNRAAVAKRDNQNPFKVHSLTFLHSNQHVLLGCILARRVWAHAQWLTHHPIILFFRLSGLESPVVAPWMIALGVAYAPACVALCALKSKIIFLLVLSLVGASTTRHKLSATSTSFPRTIVHSITLSNTNRTKAVRKSRLQFFFRNQSTRHVHHRSSLKDRKQVVGVSITVLQCS